MKVKYTIKDNRVEIDFGIEYKGKIIGAENTRLFICIVNIEGKAHMMEYIFRKFRNSMEIDGEKLEFYS